MLRSAGIRSKILAVLVVPLVLLAVTSGLLGTQAVDQARQAHQVERLTEIGGVLQGVARDLAVERLTTKAALQGDASAARGAAGRACRGGQGHGRPGRRPAAGRPGPPVVTGRRAGPRTRARPRSPGCSPSVRPGHPDRPARRRVRGLRRGHRRGPGHCRAGSRPASATRPPPTCWHRLRAPAHRPRPGPARAGDRAACAQRVGDEHRRRGPSRHWPHPERGRWRCGGSPWASPRAAPQTWTPSATGAGPCGPSAGPPALVLATPDAPSVLTPEMWLEVTGARLAALQAGVDDNVTMTSARAGEVSLAADHLRRPRRRAAVARPRRGRPALPRARPPDRPARCAR